MICFHEWGKIGMVTSDGVFYPCIYCNDAKRGGEVLSNFFAMTHGLDLKPDTDGSSKIISYEIMHEYKLHGLDIQPGEIIIDIGAHKGIVSCYLAKLYPKAIILAFEPLLENYEDAVGNISRNGIENIRVRNLAVTDDGRDVEINSDYAWNSGGATIYRTNEKIRRTVKSITLKSIIENARIALLKIDCEGAEFEILRNTASLLQRVARFRGEFHRAHGNVDELFEYVSANVNDVYVTLQG